MQNKSLKNLQNKYCLELDKVFKKIKEKKAKLVLLQFPDGLKPYSTVITDYLRSKTKNTEYLIWINTCFGACDVPVLSKEIEKKIDLIIQFGHNDLMPNY